MTVMAESPAISFRIKQEVFVIDNFSAASPEAGTLLRSLLQLSQIPQSRPELLNRLCARARRLKHRPVNRTRLRRGTLQYPVKNRYEPYRHHLSAGDWPPQP